MISALLSAMIDADPVRAETTINLIRLTWNDCHPGDEAKLKFVHFEDVDDFMAVASGNNRFSLIVVAISGLRSESFAPLQEFEDESSIVRILDEDTFVDESPLFLCKTVRFPLRAAAVVALFSSIQRKDAPATPPVRPHRIRTNSIGSTRIRAARLNADFSPPSLSPLMRGMEPLPAAVTVQKRKDLPVSVSSPCIKRYSKASAATATLRTMESKEKEPTQGPKLWQDIYSPGKLVVVLDRATAVLSLWNADETASKNLEIVPGQLRCGKDFSDFYGPASAAITIQKLIDSISCCESTTFYLNLYTCRSRTALSAHISVSVLCFDVQNFHDQQSVVAILTLRSASVVGNAKLIGYSIHNTSAQSAKNSPALRENILNAFGMN